MNARIEITIDGFENIPLYESTKIELTESELSLIQKNPHWDVMSEIVGDRIKEKIKYLNVKVFNESGQLKREYSVNENDKFHQGMTHGAGC